MNQACELNRAHYQIRVRREPYRQDGMCSQKPRINFTLLRNNLPVLKEVPFGNDCYGALGVSSVEISEQINRTDMQVCFSDMHPNDVHCVEIGPAYKEIGTRYGTEVVRHAPIDNQKFEELTAPFR